MAFYLTSEGEDDLVVARNYVRAMHRQFAAEPLALVFSWIHAIDFRTQGLLGPRDCPLCGYFIILPNPTPELEMLPGRHGKVHAYWCGMCGLHLAVLDWEYSPAAVQQYYADLMGNEFYDDENEDYFRSLVPPAS